MSSNAQKLETEFLDLATRRSAALNDNDSRLANKYYDLLYKLKQKLRELPDRGKAALKRISASPDPEVKVTAAVFLLALDEPYAIRLLEEVKAREPGLVSFTAEMTLHEWRAGSIREYWS